MAKSEKQYTRKKISTRQVKLSEQEEGFTFQGKFIGIVEGQPYKVIDEKTGEVEYKTLKNAVFEDVDTGDRIAYLADRGLEGALTESMAKAGDLLEIVKLPKVKLTKGRTMNQYDVYQLS